MSITTLMEFGWMVTVVGLTITGMPTIVMLSSQISSFLSQSFGGVLFCIIFTLIFNPKTTPHHKKTCCSIISFHMKSKLEQIEQCKLLTSTQKIFYDEIDSVYCPALKQKVIFNSDGFRHLLYESNGKSRTVQEKIYKLTLLPLVIPTIKNAINVNEERDIEIRYSRKNNAKIKKGKAYALVAFVGKKDPVKVRVILNKIGGGNLTFRSVMKH
jgi:hypothetical protein